VGRRAPKRVWVVIDMRGNPAGCPVRLYRTERGAERYLDRLPRALSTKIYSVVSYVLQPKRARRRKK
jgi:hypothetical protein